MAKVGNPKLRGNSKSGRKTLAEELAMYRETIKKQTLEEIAGMKIYNHLEKIEETDRQGVKDIALPVYLKSKTDKVDITTQGQAIYGDEQRTIIAERILRRKSAIGGSGEKLPD